MGYKMKNILFVINSLAIGGSEKSLVSLLNTFDYSKYNIDLLMLKKGETFDKYIPGQVNVLDIPNYYKYLNNQIINKSIFTKFKYMVCRYKSSFQLRINGIGKSVLKNNQQIFYMNQRKLLETLKGRYDVAIAYAQGFPTYFVVEKVKADKKFAWINCDYTATMYDKELDKTFYNRINKIIAVSEAGKNSIMNINGNYENKICVIKDIINPKLILEMSKEEVKEFIENEISILTVARLVKSYKGYDLAIEAAKLLKEQGYKFKWYAIGDGPDKDFLSTLIKKYNLEEEFILFGSRENPYPYMNKCDIYVQPSRKEGFGLTVIEAKILKKPIVCTNFSTSKELITNGLDGIIVNQNAFSIMEGIKRYLDDKIFENRIIDYLNTIPSYITVSEVEKIYKLIEN